jgi:hypothetical protein
MAYNNLTANGDTDGQCPTKDLLIVANGTFGSGTLTLKVYDEGKAGYVDYKSWTANTGESVALGAGVKYRVTLSGATTPSIDLIHRGIYGE